MNDPWKDIFDEMWLAKELGFEALELTLEYPEATPEKLEKERKGLEGELAGFKKVLAHSPWYFSLSHPYPQVRKAFVWEMKKAVEFAGGLGAELFTIHIEPFHMIYKEREALAENYMESVRELAGVCERAGVVLCVEGFEEASFPLERFRELFRELPKARMTFDIGHANLIAPNHEGVFRVMREFRKEIAHVHAHDNKGKMDEHLPIGAGRIPWEKVIAELKKFYDGTITVEDHSPDRALLRHSRESVVRMWREAKKAF